jgi:hypothetical protein
MQAFVGAPAKKNRLDKQHLAMVNGVASAEPRLYPALCPPR